MAEVFLKVDGVAMPCPSSFTWGLQDISASESGRTDDTTMHKNRVGQKRKLSVGWNGPDWDTACKIIQAVNPEYIQVTYPDLLSANKHETRTSDGMKKNLIFQLILPPKIQVDLPLGYTISK